MSVSLIIPFFLQNFVAVNQSKKITHQGFPIFTLKLTLGESEGEFFNRESIHSMIHIVLQFFLLFLWRYFINTRPLHCKSCIGFRLLHTLDCLNFGLNL